MHDILDPKLALKLSALAYAPKEFHRNEQWRNRATQDLQEIGFDFERAYFANDCVAYLAVRRFRHLAVVGVRGTDSSFDWIYQNCNFLWMHGPQLVAFPSRVRRGFGVHARNIYSDFAESLRSLRDEGVPIHLVGHSAGGAVATVLATHCLYNGSRIPLSSITTFGAPRALGRHLANHLDGKLSYNDPERVITNRCQRYVACGDPVPWVPWQLFGWRHVGQERYIDRWRNVYDERQSTWFKLRDWALLRRADRHPLAHYREALA